MSIFKTNVQKGKSTYRQEYVIQYIAPVQDKQKPNFYPPKQSVRKSIPKQNQDYTQKDIVASSKHKNTRQNSVDYNDVTSGAQGTVFPQIQIQATNSSLDNSDDLTQVKSNSPKVSQAKGSHIIAQQVKSQRSFRDSYLQNKQRRSKTKATSNIVDPSQVGMIQSEEHNLSAQNNKRLLSNAVVKSSINSQKIFESIQESSNKDYFMKIQNENHQIDQFNQIYNGPQSSQNKNHSSIKQISPIHKDVISDQLFNPDESPGIKIDALNIKKKPKSFVTGKNKKVSKMQNMGVTNFFNDSNLNLPNVEKKTTATTNLNNRLSQENITQNKLKGMPSDKTAATPYLMPRSNKQQRQQLFNESLTKLDESKAQSDNSMDSSSDDDYGEKFKHELGLNAQVPCQMQSIQLNKDVENESYIAECLNVANEIDLSDSKSKGQPLDVFNFKRKSLMENNPYETRSPSKFDTTRLGLGGQTQTNFLKQQKEKKDFQRELTIKSRARAKREKEKQICIAFERERDILRDWVRRNQPNSTPIQDNQLSTKYGGFFSQNKVEKPGVLGEAIEDKIVFQSNGRDNYFKKAAQRKGKSESIWTQNCLHSSYHFTVKWEYDDTKLNYAKMKAHQFVNHFPDSRELTTKQGLTKNLNSLTEAGTDIYQFFPRSYDLSDRGEVDLWIKDFNQTAILNIIQSHAEFFQTIVSQQPHEIQRIFFRDINVNFEACQVVKRQIENKTVLQSLTGKLISSFEGYINTAMLEAALFYAENLMSNTTGVKSGRDFQIRNNHDEYFKKNFLKFEYKLPNQLIDLLLQYSQLEIPVTNKENSLLSKFRKLKQSTWGSPQDTCVYLMFITIKMSKKLEENLPQYGGRSVNGSKNVWICKPSYNARGLGIFCFNNKSEIINTFSKKAPAPKVVQKYIERPLLLKNIDGPRDLRKFDIRQWVLLTSIEPLHVFVYKKAYLRICGSHYDIDQFNDPIRHLSNYSIQKKEMNSSQMNHHYTDITQDNIEEDDENSLGGSPSPQKNQNKLDSVQSREFVMSTDEFIQRLNQDPEYAHVQQKQGNLTWEDTFNSQIKDITKKTFRRMAEVFEHRQNSFELFGLDFVIDQNLKCWLIEANMSPACATRNGQEWLKSMCDDMSDGMVNIIEHRVLKNMESQKIDFEGPIQEKLKDIKTPDLKGWEQLNFVKTKDLIPCNELQPFYHQVTQKYGSPGLEHHYELPLEIRGFKANLKYEKKMDKRYRKMLAILFIQRVYRGFATRKIVKSILQKQEAFEDFATKLTCNFECLMNRLQNQKTGFELMKLCYLTKKYYNNDTNLEKIIKLQKIIKTRIQKRRQNNQEKVQTNLNKQEISQDILDQSLESLKQTQQEKQDNQSNENIKLNKDSPELNQQRSLSCVQSRPLQSSRNQHKSQQHQEMTEHSNSMMASRLESRVGQTMVKQTPKQDKISSIKSKKQSIYSELYKSALFNSKGYGKKKQSLSVKKKSEKYKQVIAESKNLQSEQSGEVRTQTKIKNHINIDPFLLLNPQHLGIQTILPSTGSYFHLQGGIIYRRNNPENPIEIIERNIERERIYRLHIEQIRYMQMQQQQTGQIIKGSLQMTDEAYKGVREKIKAKNTFDIYNQKGAPKMENSTFGAGFSLANQNFFAGRAQQQGHEASMTNGFKSFKSFQDTNGPIKSNFKGRDNSYDQSFSWQQNSIMAGTSTKNFNTKEVMNRIQNNHQIIETNQNIFSNSQLKKTQRDLTPNKEDNLTRNEAIQQKQQIHSNKKSPYLVKPQYLISPYRHQKQMEQRTSSMKSINSVVQEDSEDRSDIPPTIIEQEILNSTIKSNKSGAKRSIEIEPLIQDTDIQSEYLAPKSPSDKVEIIQNTKKEAMTAKESNSQRHKNQFQRRRERQDVQSTPSTRPYNLQKLNSQMMKKITEHSLVSSKISKIQQYDPIFHYKNITNTRKPSTGNNTLHKGLLKQINTQKGKNFAAASQSAILHHMRLENKERNIVNLYTNPKVGKKSKP